MNILENLLMDEFDRKARLYPAILALAPASVLLLSFLSEFSYIGSGLSVVLVACGGAFLLAQLGRDKGKGKEQDLYKKWGGMPSVAILRHSDNRIDRISKYNYHKKLEGLVEGTSAPSKEQETTDPESADEIYTAWSERLKIKTRDKRKERFPLLHKELRDYNYRRNVYGWRTLGISLSSVTLLAFAMKAYFSSAGLEDQIWVGFIINLILTMLWIFHFNSGWVETVAVEYAKRLIESVDNLAEGND